MIVMMYYQTQKLMIKMNKILKTQIIKINVIVKVTLPTMLKIAIQRQEANQQKSIE